MVRALFIARGQPPHNGHLRVLKEKIQQECDEIIVAVGSAEEQYTFRNPFSGGERVRMFDVMLSAELDKPFSVYPVVDLKSPYLYANYVRTILPSFDKVYANEATVALFKRLGYDAKTVGERIDNISGTRIRKKIAEDDLSWVSEVPPFSL
jgi:nicotinamide-nucleotide adenylyltransferase